MSSISWDKSKCVGSWLHRFNIVEEYENGVKEVCEICGKQKTFKVCDGRINNYEYLSYHIRSALPPQHNLYKHEYQ